MIALIMPPATTIKAIFVNVDPLRNPSIALDATVYIVDSVVEVFSMSCTCSLEPLIICSMALVAEILPVLMLPPAT